MAQGPARGSTRQRRRSRLACVLLLAGAALAACWGRVPSSGAAFAKQPHAELGPKGLRQRLAGLAAAHAALVACAVALVCVPLAREGPAPAPVTAPLEKRRDLQRIFVLAALLSAISGFVNVVAIEELGGTVAHQTGNTSHTGRLWGIDGVRFLILLVAYFAGAGVAGFSKCDGDAVFAGRFSPGLMSSAFAVAAGALLHWTASCGEVTLALWAFSQGLQNAITSRFGSMPIRSTHHTGSITDAGLSLGLWLRAYRLGEPTPSLAKPLFLVTIVATYAIGGFFANALWHVWGVLAALPAAACLAAIAVGNPFGSATVQKEA